MVLCTVWSCFQSSHGPKYLNTVATRGRGGTNGHELKSRNFDAAMTIKDNKSPCIGQMKTNLVPSLIIFSLNRSPFGSLLEKKIVWGVLREKIFRYYGKKILFPALHNGLYWGPLWNKQMGVLSRRRVECHTPLWMKSKPYHGLT